MQKVIVITPPATEPLTLEEAKLYGRIDFDDTDYDVASIIRHAREYCEEYQRKKYITQTLEMVLDSFPSVDYVEFTTCSPVQSITSVKYYGADGTEYTIDSNDYDVDTDSFVNKMYLKYGKRWPTITLQPYNGVRIRFVAGYGAASYVPESVKRAMVAHMKLQYDDLSDADSRRLERMRDVFLGMKRVMPI